MIEVTYNILVMFDESALSDIVTVKMDAADVDELDIYDHAEVCAALLNQFCGIKQQQGTLLKFGYDDNDLTEEMNQILIKHDVF